MESINSTQIDQTKGLLRRKLFIKQQPLDYIFTVKDLLFKITLEQLFQECKQRNNYSLNYLNV
ncbi:unnamed protein product [Paramecium sonneborni]|uniref:Uncharacterized protein n=1 Tax=Paramecium sonneborni TaxID=65129 RepID=A0A8S1RIL5_9CILI|nr:unnamed protein product [Paramecium sonneborni]